MKRILPPPDKLYDMLVNKGMSYGDVAEKYGMLYLNVQKTFKRDCRLRGIPWPVERKLSRSESQSKGLMANTMIKSLGVREVVAEYMEENSLTVAQMVAKSGASQSAINSLLRGAHDTMRRSIAIKLMTACSEDMADSLANYTPRMHQKKAAPRNTEPKRTIHKSEDVLDDWAFLRECGWSSSERIAAKLGLSVDALERTLYRYRDDPRVGNLAWVFKDQRDIPAA